MVHPPLSQFEIDRLLGHLHPDPFALRVAGRALADHRTNLIDQPNDLHRGRTGSNLRLVNGDRSNIYSSFSAANPGGSVQMINLGTTKTGLVLGFEDLAAKSGDGDYNDLVVGITNVSVSLL